MRKKVVIALYRPTSNINSLLVRKLRKNELITTPEFERTSDLDQKNHEPWLPRAYWTQRYLGRNIRKTVVLELYRPTSNINSLKEYESYAKMNLLQYLRSNQ
jgi:hypothetical protein